MISITPEGHVNEDVFAYSNRTSGAGERGLVVYHNKYAETRGWVKTSAAYMDKASGNLVQKDAWRRAGAPGRWLCHFQGLCHPLEYIRPCRELVEKGLFVQLGGYQCHVFLDWRFVSGEQWKAVYEALNGAGVPSIQAKFDELFVVKEEVKSEQGKVTKRIARKSARRQKKRYENQRHETGREGRCKKACEKHKKETYRQEKNTLENA